MRALLHFPLHPLTVMIHAHPVHVPLHALTVLIEFDPLHFKVKLSKLDLQVHSLDIQVHLLQFILAMIVMFVIMVFSIVMIVMVLVVALVAVSMTISVMAVVMLITMPVVVVMPASPVVVLVSTLTMDCHPLDFISHPLDFTPGFPCRLVESLSVSILKGEPGARARNVSRTLWDPMVSHGSPEPIIWQTKIGNYDQFDFLRFPPQM